MPLFFTWREKLPKTPFPPLGRTTKSPRHSLNECPGPVLFYCGVTVLFFRSSTNSLETVDSVMIRSSVCVPSQSA